VRSSPMARWGFLALFFLAAGFSLPAFLLGEVEKVCTSPHRETVLPAGVIHETTNFAVLVSSGTWASYQATVVDIREESSVRCKHSAPGRKRFAGHRGFTATAAQGSCFTEFRIGYFRGRQAALQGRRRSTLLLSA